MVEVGPEREGRGGDGVAGPGTVVELLRLEPAQRAEDGGLARACAPACKIAGLFARSAGAGPP